jgi:FlaA1/EpsC-like NDP-sugar epimerase
MGDPVKIIDFARDIIRLAGLTPGKDIEIKVIGLRRGEKLHEKLWSQETLVTATQFPDVFQLKTVAIPAGFDQQIAELERAALARKSDAVIQALLSRLPLDYSPDRAEETPLAVAT